MAEAVTANGGTVNNCWAFIDGTHVHVMWPSKYQKHLYSGYKKYHSLKYQAVVTPDGMIVHLAGPYPGAHHDSFMLTDSKIEQYFAMHANDANGNPMPSYGDEGYAGRGDHLQAPHQGAILMPEQDERNKAMTKPRLCVEWAFGTICNKFAFMRDHHHHRVFMSPVGTFFLLCAILSNILTTLGHNSTTCSFYRADPPTTEEYLTPLDVWTRMRQVHATSDYFNRAWENIF